MQFNTYSFILAFFPVFLLAFFTVGKHWKKQVIIIGGIIFYAFSGWEQAVVLGSSILVTEIISRGIVRAMKAQQKKKWTALCIILHAGLLLFYKYIWIIPKLTGGQGFPLPNIIQPLGFSFFSFQQMMYVLALYRGEITEHHTLDYLSYILFFPKLTMGPLAEPAGIINQIQDPGRGSWNWYNAAAGLRIFSYGLFKKMFLADTFAKAVNTFFQWLPEISSLELALIMLSYTFQIYFDFSGYMDMAAGISTMLNISLPVNFHSPYKALSFSDFWKRWHITLTRFFTKNIYIPLGGNRKGSVRTCLNIMIVFLISGMWHGAHPNFLLWGCLNGMLLIIERLIRRKEWKIPAPVAWMFTFGIINVLWLLFRSGTIGQWMGFLRQMISFNGGALTRDFTDVFFVPEFMTLLRLMGCEEIRNTMPWISAVLFMVAGLLLVLIPQNNQEILAARKKLSFGSALLAAVVLLLGILCMSTESVFIYSGF